MDEQNLQAFEVNLHDLSESERTASGNFSVAGFKIEMSRHWRPFINKYFIPCFAMVLVSFVSFIIPPGAIPGRTGLLVTLFLVMITLFRSVEVGD